MSTHGPAFLAILFLAIGLCPNGAHAQELSANDLLKKIAEAYEHISSFSVVAEKQIDFDTDTSGEMDIHPDVNRNVVPVGSHRSEYIQVRLMVTPSSKAKLVLKDGKKEVVIVSDGNVVWTLIPAQHAYTRLIPTSAAIQFVESNELSGANLLRDYENLLAERFGYRLSYDSSARLQRSEALKVGNSRKECYVLTMQGRWSPQKQTFWVDKTDFTIWKSVETSVGSRDYWGDILRTTVTLTTKQLTINPSLTDSNFVFTPPDQAKEVNSLKLSGNNPF